MVRADHVPPRAQAPANALDHPHSGFWLGLRRHTGLIQRHTFDGDFVPTKQPMNELAYVAVLLKALKGVGSVALLMIEQKELRAPGDFPEVAEHETLVGD